MSTTETPARRYRIAEVGRLTGFPPSTLRFYEEAGILGPPARTAAGYRLYDDRDVERLRLISRAKELGCTLEEISGLVEAWDADECAPVKHQLRALVRGKVADVQRHIAEQVAFAAQLQATAAALAGLPVEGPCDGSCGCTTAAEATTDASGDGCSTDVREAGSTPVVFLTRAPEGGSAPIACSLSGTDVQARIEDWQALLVEARERHPLTNGVRLVFGASAPLAEISRLAAAEYDCCPFFAFSITVDARGIALEVTAPADGQAALDAVFGVAG